MNTPNLKNMIKSILIGPIILLFCIKINAQKNEYQYFSFRLGIIHNFINPQPANPIDNYVLGSDNQLNQIYSENNILFDYSASLSADLLYHFDFTNDKTGIIAGLSFQTKKYSFDYIIDNLNNRPKDRYETYEISIPLVLKFGKHVFKKMKFYYVGTRLNYIVSASNENNYQYNLDFKLDKQELKPFKTSISAGFNYCIYSIEVEYQINSIFNKSFQNSNGNSIYSTQQGNFIFFKTCIHICPRYFSNGQTPCFPFRIIPHRVRWP
jgi:hypothetical protein